MDQNRPDVGIGVMVKVTGEVDRDLRVEMNPMTIVNVIVRRAIRLSNVDINLLIAALVTAQCPLIAVVLVQNQLIAHTVIVPLVIVQLLLFDHPK